LGIWSEIRGAGFAAVGVMTLCAGLAAGQNASSDAPAKAPAKKSTTSRTASQQHHTSTSKTSGSSATTKKSSSKTHTSGKKSSKKKSTHARGQQKIDSERAQAIQEALIREHYLTGEATGTWNQASEEAMRKYQADQGWQSKTVPDSRALIKLGLGPSKDGLLNPDSAMTTVPDAPKPASLPPTSHSTPPATDPLPAAASTPSNSASPQ
jgi:hypothetical protein